MEQNGAESKIVDAEIQAAYITKIDGNDPLETLESSLVNAGNQVTGDDMQINNVEMVASRLLCRLEDAIRESRETNYSQEERKGMVEAFREVSASRVAPETSGRRAIRKLQDEIPWRDFSYTLLFDEIEVE